MVPLPFSCASCTSAGDRIKPPAGVKVGAAGAVACTFMDAAQANVVARLGWKAHDPRTLLRQGIPCRKRHHHGVDQDDEYDPRADTPAGPGQGVFSLMTRDCRHGVWLPHFRRALAPFRTCPPVPGHGRVRFHSTVWRPVTNRAQPTSTAAFAAEKKNGNATSRRRPTGLRRSDQPAIAAP